MSTTKGKQDVVLISLCFFFGRLGYRALFINSDATRRFLGAKKVGLVEDKDIYVFVFNNDGSLEIHYADEGKEDELILFTQTEITKNLVVKTFFHTDNNFYLEYTQGHVC